MTADLITPTTAIRTGAKHRSASIAKGPSGLFFVGRLSMGIFPAAFSTVAPRPLA